MQILFRYALCLYRIKKHTIFQLSIKSAASQALSSSKAAMVAFAHSKNHESGSLKLHVRTNDDLYMTIRNFSVKRFPLRHIGDLRRNRNTGTHWIRTQTQTQTQTQTRSQTQSSSTKPSLTAFARACFALFFLPSAS